MTPEIQRRTVAFLKKFYQSDRYKAHQKWLNDLVQKNRERMYTKDVPTKE